jgi:hypothetical protein
MLQVRREELAERRAEEVAAKKKHKERLAGIKCTIVDALVGMGMPETFGNAVASLIEKRGALLKALDENGSLDHARLEVFNQEVRHAWFDGKLMMTFPSWRLTDFQKTEVIQKVVEKLSAVELQSFVASGAIAKEPNAAPSECSVWRDALASAMEVSHHFTCPICMDPLVTLSSSGLPRTSNMWFAPLHKNHHWSSQPCGHACCRTCMKTWAETSINDHKVNIRCPAPDCNYCLFDHDVRQLVSAQAFERHQEHKNTDYLQHLKSALKEDSRLKHWLKTNARPCPDCHVIVSRSEGCDHMRCVCGTNFCYACGFKSCKCNQQKEKRRDIWKPKATPKQQEPSDQ